MSAQDTVTATATATTTANATATATATAIATTTATATPNAARERQEGGCFAYVVLCAAFLCHGLSAGIINSYSVVYSNLEKNGIGDPSTRSAIGSLAVGVLYFSSAVTGITADRFGLRIVAIVGGVLATLGMVMSAVFSHNVHALLATYGLIFGVGASLTYTPSLAILGHYFSGRLGFVSGVVSSAGAVFMVAIPVVLEYTMETAQLHVMFVVLALLCCAVAACTAFFRPRLKTDLLDRPTLKTMILKDNWRKKKYLIWSLSVAVTSLGYYVPFVYIGAFVASTFGQPSNMPMMCIGVCSAVARFIVGLVADLPKVNKMTLYQIAFYGMGLAYIGLPFVRHQYQLIAVSVLIGIFDGIYDSLYGPIAYELCGQEGATQAIGFTLALSSPSIISGSPLAGLIYDSTNSYTLLFICAGVTPLIGATILFWIRFVEEQTLSLCDERGLTVFTIDNGKYVDRSQSIGGVDNVCFEQL